MNYSKITFDLSEYNPLYIEILKHLGAYDDSTKTIIMRSDMQLRKMKMTVQIEDSEPITLVSRIESNDMKMSYGNGSYRFESIWETTDNGVDVI